MENESFRDHVTGIFQQQSSVQCKPYLHVVALYHGACFFGIITNDKLYFRTNDFTRQWYTHRRLQPFPIPMADARHFYEVPQKIIDNRRILMKLAREAMAVCREQVPQSPIAESIDW